MKGSHRLSSVIRSLYSVLTDFVYLVYINIKRRPRAIGNQNAQIATENEITRAFFGQKIATSFNNNSKLYKIAIEINISGVYLNI